MVANRLFQTVTWVADAGKESMMMFCTDVVTSGMSLYAAGPGRAVACDALALRTPGGRCSTNIACSAVSHEGARESVSPKTGLPRAMTLWLTLQTRDLECP